MGLPDRDRTGSTQELRVPDRRQRRGPEPDHAGRQHDPVGTPVPDAPGPGPRLQGPAGSLGGRVRPGRSDQGAVPQRGLVAAIRFVPRSEEVPGPQGELPEDLVADLSPEAVLHLLHLQRQLDCRCGPDDDRGPRDLRAQEVPGGGRKGRRLHPVSPDARSAARLGPAVRSRHASGLGPQVRASFGHRRGIPGRDADTDIPVPENRSRGFSQCRAAGTQLPEEIGDLQGTVGEVLRVEDQPAVVLHQEVPAGLHRR